jgi:hypothetical protein
MNDIEVISSGKTNGFLFVSFSIFGYGFKFYNANIKIKPGIKKFQALFLIYFM